MQRTGKYLPRLIPWMSALESRSESRRQLNPNPFAVQTFARKGRCATAPHFLAAFYIGERLYLHFEGIMADKYRMIPHGSGGFIVNHNTAGIVGVFKTETEAQQEMKDCERDD